MKFILYLAIALSFLLLLGYTHEVAKEVRARDRLQSEEIMALKGQIRVIQVNIKHMNRPFTKVIPIDGGFLGIRGEKNEKRLSPSK